jgi:hypothetical protein
MTPSEVMWTSGYQETGQANPPTPGRRGHSPLSMPWAPSLIAAWKLASLHALVRALWELGHLMDGFIQHS